jgi:uncharacterized membrane protein
MRSLKPALWAALLVFASFNGLMAFQYFFAILNGTVPWWIQVQAWFVSDAFSLGRNSVHETQHALYMANNTALLVHATTGAIALASGVVQFSRTIQTRYTAMHRLLGRIYMVSVLASMAGGIGYLSSVSLWQVYSGPHFAIGLWALDLMVILTAVLAYAAIRGRNIAAHRAWVVFNTSNPPARLSAG